MTTLEFLLTQPITVIQDIQQVSDREERLEFMVKNAANTRIDNYPETWLYIAKLATSIATFYVDNPNIWSDEKHD